MRFGVTNGSLILVQWPDLEIVKKREPAVVRADFRVKFLKSEKRDKYIDLATEQKTMEHEDDGDPNYRYDWTNPQRTGKGTWRLEN